MTLSSLIKDYRERHDMSQRQFAVLSGLSNGYISMLEKNENPKTGLPVIPSLPALNKIATAMGLSIEELLSTVDDMPVNITENIDNLSFTDPEPSKYNIVKIAARDGSYQEKRLSDEDLAVITRIIDTLPDAADDL